MASPYLLNNADLQNVNVPTTEFQVYLAFLNPISITTNWVELGLNADSSWQAPGNTDTAALHMQPYAPTINMGGNRIGFVNEPLYFDASRSCQRHDIPVMTNTFQWGITGPSNSVYYANGSQAQVTWTSPGLYSIQVSASDRAATQVTAYRQVQIYQDRQSALPGIISISGLSGSLSSGGWQMQCTSVNTNLLMQNSDALPPGTYLPVVLMMESRFEVMPDYWVDETLGPFGQFNPGYPYRDPRILFDGYVQTNSVHQDVDKGTLTFSCMGPQMILQEAKTHMLGYYNCTYKSIVNGVPTGCNVSPMGNGYQVGNLTTTDVVRSLLYDHCNIGHYHDIQAWDPNIPTQPYQPPTTSSPNSAVLPAVWNMIYSTIGTNEGTVWSCIQDMTSNDWSQIYCDRDGSILFGPQVNFQGGDYWQYPTLLGKTAAPGLLNLVQDLGFTVSTNDPSQMTSQLPTLPAQPMPVEFVHPWGPQPAPTPFLSSFGSSNSALQQTQSNLVGPPILCIFSDTPIYDTDTTPPDVQALYPWVVSNWPQDLAIYPVSIDMQENYTGRAALVKLIGTLASNNATWSSWDPQDTFNQANSSGVSTVITVLPASDWIVDEKHILPDVTVQQNANLVWHWFWEMPKRVRAAHNVNYSGSVTCGLFTGASLNDIVAVTQQQNTVGPKFNNKLFFVEEISYALDLTARTWQTTLSLGEVTSATLDPIATPPFSIPVS